MLNRYSIGFVNIGMGLGCSAILQATTIRWTPTTVTWLLSLVYLSAAFLVLGIAYAGVGPKLLGKRRDGRRQWWAIAWSLPYSLLNEGVWWLTTQLHREPAICVIAENLYCGRRLTRRDQALFDNIPLQGCLDLTAEFTEAQFLRSTPHYRCAPILDGTAPTVVQLQELVDWLTSMTSTGAVYVHCALGHGRTATVIVAYLVSQGLDPDIDSALSRMRQHRPGVDINSEQRKLLSLFCDKSRGCCGFQPFA